MINKEAELQQWDLFKSYGEFNLVFESIIAEFKKLLIQIVRLSYEYEEEEDENGEELSDHEQDRLIKIILSNSGAMEMIQNYNACFVDYFNAQKSKFGEFSYTYNGVKLTLSHNNYEFIMVLCAKAKELVELRNQLIHSHFNQGLFLAVGDIKLIGQKDRQTNKGYERRQFKLDIQLLDKLNLDMNEIQNALSNIKYMIWLGEFEFAKENIQAIKNINFKISKDAI